MKNTIFNKFPKQPHTIYNVLRCFIAWFTFVGTANWYQGIDHPTIWQRFYRWRISPKTAWTLASGIWFIADVSKSFYCQNEIEMGGKCDEQCEHCKEYYKPLDQ